MNTIFTGFIAAGGNYSPVTGAAYYDRFSLQRGIVDNFNGYKEGIQIKMGDMADLCGHLSKLVKLGARNQEPEEGSQILSEDNVPLRARIFLNSDF
jgi:hypothetical protein